MIRCSRPRYEPTEEEIRVGCERIRAGWNKFQRSKRVPREDTGRVPWQVPVILDIVDSRGEYVVVMRNA
jgi:predicted  nucleic acid-binding Zn-ribbon protein